MGALRKLVVVSADTGTIPHSELKARLKPNVAAPISAAESAGSAPNHPPNDNFNAGIKRKLPAV